MRGADVSEPNFRQPRWSQDEAAIAADLYQRLFVDIYGDDEGPRGARARVLQRIAATIGRSFFSVERRLIDHGPSFGRGYAGLHGTSSHALAERDQRKEAEMHRDLTASVFGDPPPGFSALDRR